MTTPNLPDLSQFGADQLLALRDAVDAKLADVRAEFIEKASALGLSVVDGPGKKVRKRRSPTKENE